MRIPDFVTTFGLQNLVNGTKFDEIEGIYFEIMKFYKLNEGTKENYITIFLSEIFGTFSFSSVE